MLLSAELLPILACPLDGSPLSHPWSGDSRLLCSNPTGDLHEWPVVDGIPVLLPSCDDLAARGLSVQRAMMEETRALAANPGPDPYDGEGVHPQVQAIVASTGGFMYAGVSLTEYPIPELRMPAGQGRTLLDVGCNWGRWTVAAARAGYRAVGLDPHLTSLRAARHVARACGVEAAFVCGDARLMPFKAEAFERAFSYSVIQHFAKDEARIILREVARVIRPGGESVVQMPNRAGLRSLYHRARRSFGEGQRFDVRYYSRRELVEMFATAIGTSTLTIDGFFGLGVQPTDRALMPPFRRVVIHASEFLRRAARRQRWLAQCADSVYVTSRKPMKVEHFAVSRA